MPSGQRDGGSAAGDHDDDDRRLGHLGAEHGGPRQPVQPGDRAVDEPPVDCSHPLEERRLRCLRPTFHRLSVTRTDPRHIILQT